MFIMEIFRPCFLCLFLFLILALVKFLHTVFWTPMRIQYLMRAQGIRGPSYKLIHGNTKEISKMRDSSMSKTMELTHDIFPRIHPHIHAWINIYGTNFLFWRGCRAQLVITEPELIKEMLNNKDEYSRSDIDKYMKKIIGDGLVASEGEKWLRLRKLSNHAFHAENLRDMMPAMVESVELMLRRWKGYHHAKEIEASEEFRLLTAEIISRTAFGSSYLEGEHIFQMLRKLAILSSKNAYRTRLPGIRGFKNGDDKESRKLDKDIQSMITEIIRKRQHLTTPEAHSFGTDFLGSLLKAYHDVDENNRISFADIIGECKTFYSAGHGTTAVLLSWTVFLLAIHTDWQERAREEVLDVFGKLHPTSEGISRLKIMTMIISESLRLYPPVPATERKAKKAAKLGNLIVPANTNLSVPILGLHHDPRIWGEDADLFRPERFSEGVAKATNKNPAAFLPFGLGPRICVGSNFAITEAKITLSMILQQYRFTLSPNYIHSPVQIITIRPKHGVLVMVHAL